MSLFVVVVAPMVLLLLLGIFVSITFADAAGARQRSLALRTSIVVASTFAAVVVVCILRYGFPLY